MNQPIFLKDLKVKEILLEVKKAIPKNSQAYLVGGSVRNSLYYKFFKEELPQRDYDIVFIGDKKKFIANLKKQKFIYGLIRTEDTVVLKKKKVFRPNKKDPNDYVVLDINFSKLNNILENIKKKANFTVSSFALNLKYINSINWYREVIKIRGALKDLKNKQLKVNAFSHPTNLFACLRFMSKGFLPPKKNEVKKLLLSLKELYSDEDRYNRNIKKLYNYVGGEREARKLLKRLEININIFKYSNLTKIK
jgi:hypothetical protein